MPFRNVVIDNRCKIEYSLNYMVCRIGNEEKRILLDEIRSIIINSTQVSITASFITEASKKKIKIMFCDEKHNPECEMIPYQNNYYSYRKICEQINFDRESMDYLWKRIIEQKIINQANNLMYIGNKDKANMLIEYSKNVELGDVSNREGHSAKVYFYSIFGPKFSRETECDENKFLNYGYAIILSLINREIKILGYLTEFGIHHIGESNPFNLACDLMEPLRPLVDYYVLKKIVDNNNFRIEFVNMLSKKVYYNGKDIFLDNAIHLYVEDMINFLKTGNMEKIRFIKYEL